MTLRPSSYEAALDRQAGYDERRKAKLAGKSPETRGIRVKSTFKPRKPQKPSKTIPRSNVPDQPEGEYGANRGITRKRRRGVRIDVADRYFSLFIRYRDNWQCQRCFTSYEVGSQGLHNSHHFGRARENTRFDPVNCDALCHGCHAFFTANPVDHCAWKLKRTGQVEYDKLTIRANMRCKKDRVFMAMVCKQMFEKEKARFETERT